MNRKGAAEALRRNITLRANGADVSLRSTRTSEVSSFVKNCNLAEKHALKRELNMWHKDTNFAVRKVTSKQEDMYKALLKLSCTKKQIKTEKLGKIYDRQSMRRWIHSKRRKRRDDITVLEEDEVKLTSPQVLKINYEQANDKLSKLTKSSSSLCKNKQSSKQHNNTLMSSSVDQHNPKIYKNNDIYSDSSLPTKKKLLLPRQQCDVSIQQDINHVGKTNYTVISKAKTTSLLEDKGNILPNYLLTKVHLAKSASTKECNTQIPNLPLLRPLKFENDRNSRFWMFTHGTTLTEEDKESLSENSGVMAVESQDTAAASIDVSVNDAKLRKCINAELPFKCGVSQDLSKATKKKRRKYRITLKQNLKSQNDEHVNTSSIAIRPGKAYNVTVYKKGESGDFEGDVATWDTTVDVAKHFHLSSKRERFERQKMLEDARQVEVQQQRRVDEFLYKLHREKDSNERTKNRIRDIDEIQALKMRMEARKRGPPKYGISEVTNVPNYIRKYLPAPDVDKSTARLRKRSSWSVPSLFTLQIAAANSRTRNKDGPFDGNQAQSVLGEGPSHLVNINIEKYLLDAANA